MVSSKQIIEITGISRATLNNYISLGILSKPRIRNPGIGSRGPRQLGYFADDAVGRIEQVQRLKKEGLTMSEIVSRLSLAPEPGAEPVRATAAADAPVPAALAAGSLRVTLDDIPHPAYMVGHSFELAWINPQARERLFGGAVELPATSDGRSLFRLLPAARPEWYSLFQFHIGLAKGRLSPERFSDACRGVDPVAFARLQAAYAEAEALTTRPMLSAALLLPDAQGEAQPHRAYASFFREGIFVVLVPEHSAVDAMLELMARRDEVIRSLLRRRLPVLTHLAVMVADLQSSVKICSELPPEEYFELINEIWSVTAPIFRKYQGTCGKHVGDGLVNYFFPQPDSDYLGNALACALAIRDEMKKLSKAWQLRKNWLNELYLNTGITEGQEWLGTYQSSSGVEFVVLGDTINQASRISDFARHGSIWATKSLIGKLPKAERERVSFGVRRRAADGREMFVASSFSQVSSLLEQEGATMEKLRDVATLAITEVTDIAPSAA